MHEADLLDQDILSGKYGQDSLVASSAKVRRLKQRLPGLAEVASHEFGAIKGIAGATEDAKRTETDQA